MTDPVAGPPHGTAAPDRAAAPPARRAPNVVADGRDPARAAQWQARAACTVRTARMFFSGDGERALKTAAREDAALAVCAECPVRRRCLEFALAEGLAFGVFGGATEVVRARARRRVQRPGRSPSAPGLLEEVEALRSADARDRAARRTAREVLEYKLKLGSDVGTGAPAAPKRVGARTPRVSA